MTAPNSWRLPIAVILALFACGAGAQQQQRRLTDTLPETPATAAATTTTEPLRAPDAGPATSLPPQTSPFADAAPPAPVAASTRPARHEIGDATRALLRLQAEGTYAGRSLPILGDQASRSYKRYLDSFDYPIPERFEQTVRNNNQTQ
ncbi:DUF3613 domain-containing protein [[Pseudomonas] boreopolis]|uniref:DUF3613 domain-containing protein n=1 Tax=Xanthomonas boreopolis TaxID=86183 RepID=UPI003D9BB744